MRVRRNDKQGAVPEVRMTEVMMQALSIEMPDLDLRGQRRDTEVLKWLGCARSETAADAGLPLSMILYDRTML